MTSIGHVTEEVSSSNCWSAPNQKIACPTSRTNWIGFPSIGLLLDRCQHDTIHVRMWHSFFSKLWHEAFGWIFVEYLKEAAGGWNILKYFILATGWCSCPLLRSCFTWTSTLLKVSVWLAEGRVVSGIDAFHFFQCHKDYFQITSDFIFYCTVISQ